MSSLTIRPFSRADRDQLTALINGHARAVVPGVSVSVNAVLSQLEAEPQEFITGPWVERRTTLVAELADHIVGGALLNLYGDDERVGEAYRATGEVRWLVFWPASPTEPPNPFWPDPSDAGPQLLTAATEQLIAWGARKVAFGGSLPTPGVYGVPEQFAHVRAALLDAGWQHDGDVEMVFLARPSELAARRSGIEVVRSVGINGTRLTGNVGDHCVGYVEVELRDAPHWGTARPLLADLGNFDVLPAYREAMLAEAGRWLERGGADGLLSFAGATDLEWVALLEATGFQHVTRTERGWTTLVH